MEQFILEHWKELFLGYIILEKMIKALEKIVRKTPAKWDDVIFDLLIAPVFGGIKTIFSKKKVGKK